MYARTHASMHTRINTHTWHSKVHVNVLIVILHCIVQNFHTLHGSAMYAVRTSPALKEIVHYSTSNVITQLKYNVRNEMKLDFYLNTMYMYMYIYTIYEYMYTYMYYILYIHMYI